MAADNKPLETLHLMESTRPRGMPQIEVLDIDANGIVNVSAKDKGTGKEQKITHKTGGLSESEIDKMVKDAEANKEADKQKREGIDTRNNADAMVHNVEKQLKEHGDKLSAEDKTKVESDINDLKEALKGSNVEDIKTKTETLTQSAMKLGEAIYKQQQESEQKANTESDKPKDDNVVDADFEEVSKDK